MGRLFALVFFGFLLFAVSCATKNPRLSFLLTLNCVFQQSGTAEPVMHVFGASSLSKAIQADLLRVVSTIDVSIPQ